MKIIITGANGMLGSSLCRLYREEHEVIALHRDEECYTSCFTDHSLDLSNSIRLKNIISKIKPDILVHCGGLTSIDFCEKEPLRANKTNISITENIAQNCPDRTKMIYISTDQVYGKTQKYSENNENLKPINHYGITKLQGEQIVQDQCKNFIIIRTNIFGWNIKPRRVSSAEWMYNSLKNGENITLFYDYTFSPIFTECLGYIILQLIEKNFSGIINVGSPKPCSKFEFGLQLAKEFGFDHSLIRKGYLESHHFLAPRQKNLTLDVRHLRSLGINPPNLLESMSQFYQKRLTFC